MRLYANPEFQSDDPAQQVHAAAVSGVAPDIEQFGPLRKLEQHGRIHKQRAHAWSETPNPLPVTRLANRTTVIPKANEWFQILTFNEERFYFLLSNATGAALQFSFDKSPWNVGITLNINGIFQQMGVTIACNEIYVRSGQAGVVVVCYEGVAVHRERIAGNVDGRIA